MNCIECEHDLLVHYVRDTEILPKFKDSPDCSVKGCPCRVFDKAKR